MVLALSSQLSEKTLETTVAMTVLQHKVGCDVAAISTRLAELGIIWTICCGIYAVYLAESLVPFNSPIWIRG